MSVFSEELMPSAGNPLLCSRCKNYDADEVPPQARNSAMLSGSVPLGPGEHKVCLEVISTTSGVMDKILPIKADPLEQKVAPGADAEFTA